MRRSEALQELQAVAAKLQGHGRVRFVESSLTLDEVPVAFVNPSNAVVVHGVEGVGRGARTFPREGSAELVAALILSRFGAVGRAA